MSPLWRRLKRAATLGFFLLVAWLLVAQTRAVKWDAVGAALLDYPRPVLLGAAALAVLSLILYSAFDLLGRHSTGHRLRTASVMRVTFICYVFNLNLGALVGGVAMRYRLYSRLGLDADTITRVMLLSMLTNWSGYLLLGGVIFAFYPVALPPDWPIGRSGLQLLGLVLLALALLYLLLCTFSRKRNVTVKGQRLTLPSLRLAMLQMGMGAANWLLMSGAVYLLLQQRVAFASAAGVLLAAAVAGVVTHVPAGLGVLEAVFLVMLSHQLPPHELLAALLAYRGLYYLAPLALATVLFLVVEARAKK